MTNAQNFSQETVEAVFELWAFHAGQSAAECERRLNRDPALREACGILDGEKIPSANRINRWSRDYFWAHKSAERMRQHFPMSMTAAAITLANQAGAAALGIQRTLSKHEAGEDLTRSDEIFMAGCWKLINATVGDQIIEVSKKSMIVEEAIEDLRKLTPQQLAEAERRMLSEG